jgi:GAF domain-containing protein
MVDPRRLAECRAERATSGREPRETTTPEVTMAEQDTASAPDVYADVLARLGAVGLDTPQLTDVLGQLIAIAVDATSGLTAVSVTSFDHEGHYETAATTSEIARQVDQEEYEAGSGPCVDAIETGELQISHDVLADERWPWFSEVAASRGFRSVAGVPLTTNGRTVGALNLYAAEPQQLRETLELATRLAGPLATVVANAQALRRVTRLGEDLEDELDELAAVEQAVGVLMVERSWDADTAERALHRTAEATDRTIDEVARRVVAAVQQRSGP